MLTYLKRRLRSRLIRALGIDSLNSRVDARLGQLDGNISGIGAQLNAARDEIGSARSDIGSLGVRLDEARGDIGSVGAQLDKARGEISSVGARLDETRGEISSVGGRLDDTRGEISSVGTRLDEARGEINQSRGELAATKAIVSYVLNRDVCLVQNGPFFLYQFRDDWASQSMLADPRWRHLVDIPIDEAQRSIATVVEQRAHARMDSSSVLREYWSATDRGHHNAIHRALLACLTSTGRDVHFVDVGGNTGDTALYAVDTQIRLGSQAHAFCFEPGPVFELARANIWLNRMGDRIEMINAAASDSDGYIPMRIMVGHSESGSIAGINKHYSELPVGETRMVQTVQLDTYFASRGELDFYLKIDAEGHDFSVIRGAQKLIDARRVPTIHLEVTPKYMGEAERQLLLQCCDRYALFNLRTLDATGAFDQLERISPDDFSEFMTRTANFHGWTDVALIDNALADSAPFDALLRDRYAPGASV